MPTQKQEEKKDERVMFKNTHSSAIDLASGLVVGVGEFVKLTPKEREDPHNAAYIEDEKLVEASVPEEEEGGK